MLASLKISTLASSLAYFMAKLSQCFAFNLPQCRTNWVKEVIYLFCPSCKCEPIKYKLFFVGDAYVCCCSLSVFHCWLGTKLSLRDNKVTLNFEQI